MKLNIDHLLDSDVLTPAQQRAVRRFVNYHLEHFGDGLVFNYYFESTNNQKFYYKIIANSLEELKTKYPELIHNILRNYSKKYVNTNYLLMTQVATIFNNDPLKNARTINGHILGFNDIDQTILRLPAYREITVKSLWQVLELIFAEIDKEKQKTGNY